MHILITGHLGYVGSALTPMLLARGHRVQGVDSDLYRGCDLGPPSRPVPGIGCDIRDLDRHHLEGIEAVIHLAGLSNDPLGDLDPAVTAEINCQATLRLAEMARDSGVRRLVFASSCSVYGAAGDGWVCEDSALNPVTPYARSKAHAEAALAELASARFSPVSLRAGTVYGLTPRIRFDLVLNNLVAWAHTSGRVHLKSDGRAWRPLLHVNDMALAFVAAVEADARQVHNRCLNIGRTADNYRVVALAQVVAKTVPGAKVRFGAGAGPDARSYRVRCDAVQRALAGFQPCWNIDRGIEQLRAAYQRFDLRADEFEGPRFQRVARLMALRESGELDASLRWRSRMPASAGG
jgi:nucleoside-diphosphate-sugar epimerase